MTPTSEVLARHHVLVGSDKPWQRPLRLLQALWREEQDLLPGDRDGKPGEVLGSRLAMPAAKQSLANFLTDTVRSVVRSEMETAGRDLLKLIKEPRIYNDLLSSQPLCFNLFGELKADLGQATAWARHLWPERVATVTRVEFEHSPGRRDDRYLGNRTAFDVYLEHTVPGGGEGFIGIEVKYHEDLDEDPADTRARVYEVADRSGRFDPRAYPELSTPPLQQVWFDHLLALSMLQADASRWGQNGLYVLMHPAANEPCFRVAARYRQHLTDGRSFQSMTLEEAVGVLRVTCGAPWVESFSHRYLDYSRAAREQ
jgi:hypothetical protein